MPERLKTLWDSLVENGEVDPNECTLPAEPTFGQLEPRAGEQFLHLTGKAFADAVLNSNEFKLYIIDALQDGTLPSAVLVRLMDYAWGKPVEHVKLDHELRVSKVVREIVDAPGESIGKSVH